MDAEQNFITNRFGYYFNVKADLDKRELKGCKFHESEAAMVAYVCVVNKLTMDEVEGNSFLIYNGGFEDTSGHWDELEISLEVFIANFRN